MVGSSGEKDDESVKQIIDETVNKAMKTPTKKSVKVAKNKEVGSSSTSEEDGKDLHQGSIDIKNRVDSVEEKMLELHGEEDKVEQQGLKTPNEETSPERPLVKPAPRKREPPLKEAATTSVNNKVGKKVVSKRLAFNVPKNKRVSKTVRAGLVFSVPRVKNNLKAGRYVARIQETSAVFLAAVLEYLVAEVLELAGNCARFYKRRRIFPRCLQLTFLHDKELAELTRGAVVPQGGVKPSIHPVLLGNKGTTHPRAAPVEPEEIF